MNRNLAICATAVLALATAYFASPLLAFQSLRDAGESGDRERLEATVDFPVLRTNLKSDLNALMLVKLRHDREFQSNPFSGFAALFAPVVIDRMIDAYLTPEAISMMITNAKVPPVKDARSGKEPAESSAHDVRITTRYAYITLDRFRVTLLNEGSEQRPVSLILERRGIFAWKLVRIELPADAFQ